MADLFVERDDAVYPYTSIQLMAVADLCIHFQSGAVLEAAGSSMDKVLKVNVYLSDIKNFDGMNEVYRGYWMVDWFKRQFGSREVAQATELGVPPEALFDDLVRDTPPGSMGLLLQPTWSPGTPASSPRPTTWCVTTAR